jgi:hypothetical protein
MTITIGRTSLPLGLMTITIGRTSLPVGLMTITIGRTIRMALFIIGQRTIRLVDEGPIVRCHRCSGHRRRSVRSGFTDTLAALGVITAVGGAMALGRGMLDLGAKVGAEGRAAQLHTAQLHTQLYSASSASSSIRSEGKLSRLAWQRARPAMIATTRAAAATTRSPLALGQRPPRRL